MPLPARGAACAPSRGSTLTSRMSIASADLAPAAPRTPSGDPLLPLPLPPASAPVRSHSGVGAPSGGRMESINLAALVTTSRPPDLASGKPLVGSSDGSSSVHWSERARLAACGAKERERQVVPHAAGMAVGHSSATATGGGRCGEAGGLPNLGTFAVTCRWQMVATKRAQSVGDSRARSCGISRGSSNT